MSPLTEMILSSVVEIGGVVREGPASSSQPLRHSSSVLHPSWWTPNCVSQSFASLSPVLHRIGDSRKIHDRKSTPLALTGTFVFYAVTS